MALMFQIGKKIVDGGRVIFYSLNMENETLKLIKKTYSILGDVRNNWVGRDSQAGQSLLSELRDTIAEAENTDEQEVQNNCTVAFYGY